MAKNKNEYRVPNYVGANSRAALIQAMLNNNLKDKKEYDYYFFEKDGNNYFAWYYKSVKPANAEVF